MPSSMTAFNMLMRWLDRMETGCWGAQLELVISIYTDVRAAEKKDRLYRVSSASKKIA
jgi:hypothetical protein